MAERVTVSPAYGRDYKSKKAVVEDWLAGKDFTVESYGPHMGSKVSVSDAKEMGLKVSVRYKRLTMVTEVPNE